jgi:hypothetical protein
MITVVYKAVEIGWAKAWFGSVQNVGIWTFLAEPKPWIALSGQFFWLSVLARSLAAVKLFCTSTQRVPRQNSIWLSQFQPRCKRLDYWRFWPYHYIRNPLFVSGLRSRVIRHGRRAASTRGACVQAFLQKEQYYYQDILFSD